MTLSLKPICWRCRHFRERTPGGTGTCDAFPAAPGIPTAIWTSAADHREPFQGDHGIHFAPQDAEAAHYAETLFAADN